MDKLDSEPTFINRIARLTKIELRDELENYGLSIVGDSQTLQIQLLIKWLTNEGFDVLTKLNRDTDNVLESTISPPVSRLTCVSEDIQLVETSEPRGFTSCADPSLSSSISNKLSVSLDTRTTNLFTDPLTSNPKTSVPATLVSSSWDQGLFHQSSSRPINANVARNVRISPVGSVANNNLSTKFTLLESNEVFQYNRPPFGLSISPTVQTREQELGRLSVEKAKSRSTCFNCDNAGHRFRKCTERKKVFCFACGNKGFRTRDCPKCKLKIEKKKQILPLCSKSGGSAAVQETATRD